ncbi:efflux RND transporter periplasmic adaptor subunit [Crenobacter luteus]|uniref:efflux RND transporter periplasmic adaptor subunit n=1 Tax=Crenobacter luteus TaxID=1452487 RepID=UPI000A5F8E83|nr:efflux RND transporter periplasmic adaptor subunit [Crenobacter luteus]
MRSEAFKVVKSGGRLAALVALAVGLAACGKEGSPAAQGNPPPVPVAVITAAARDVPVAFEFVGQTAGSREVEVRARVGGILVKRAYTEGKPVRAGDLLFQIDPAPFQAALDQAQGALKVEEAQLARTRQDYDRILPLFKENAVSQKDRDDAQAAYQSAQASVAAARARLKEAQINLGYTRVTAPISGMTSKEVRSEGSLVGTGGDSLLTTISQIDPMYVNFSFSDNDLLAFRRDEQSGKLKLPEGKNFEVSLKLADGSSYAKSGRLNFTDNLVDSSTGSVRARAEFANPGGELLPGQFVRVFLNGARRVNAILIPQRAVLTAQQGKLVWVVGADSTVAPRPVTLGTEIGDQVLVEAGLKPGDKVVVDNIIKLRPGAKVAASPAKPAAQPAAQS